jgi:hypothetical protein
VAVRAVAVVGAAHASSCLCLSWWTRSPFSAIGTV